MAAPPTNEEEAFRKKVEGGVMFVMCYENITT
jgi:hypothetical protein